MASSADSFSVSVMGARILATAAKSMGGGGSETSLSRASVAGVGLGTDGGSEWEPSEVTFFIAVEDMARSSLWGLVYVAVMCRSCDLEGAARWWRELDDLVEVSLGGRVWSECQWRQAMQWQSQ
jgi:hypothetical protein